MSNLAVVAISTNHSCQTGGNLQVNGNSFNVNILKQGSEGPVMKALLKTFEPGEDRFGGVEHHRSESNDCVVLEEAVRTAFD